MGLKLLHPLRGLPSQSSRKEEENQYLLCKTEDLQLKHHSTVFIASIISARMFDILDPGPALAWYFDLRGCSCPSSTAIRSLGSQ